MLLIMSTIRLHLRSIAQTAVAQNSGIVATTSNIVGIRDTQGVSTPIMIARGCILGFAQEKVSMFLQPRLTSVHGVDRAFTNT